MSKGHYNGWIGVDFDGTLAHYEGWKGAGHLGLPIESMVERVKAWRAEGREVRIFTARVFAPTGDVQAQKDSALATLLIQTWCRTHIGEELPVTCVKDYGMIELWDDRAVQVLPNTGKRADAQDEFST